MITTLKQQLYHHNPLRTAWVFALAVIILLPALLFSRFMPGWAPIVAIVGLAIIFLLRILAIGRLTGHPSIDWPLFTLLLMLPVGLWATPDASISLPRTYAFVANLALFWAVAAQRNNAWFGQKSGWLLLLAGLLFSIIVLLGTRFGSNKFTFIDQNIYGPLPGAWQPFWRGPEHLGLNPNLSGGLLALFWMPATVLIWHGNTWQQRDIAKLVAVILLLAILLTQSRGALLGVLVALIVVTSIHHWRWFIFWAVMLVVGGIWSYQLGFQSVLTDFLTERGTLAVSNLQSRQTLWQHSLHLMLDFPLTGVGLGMIEPVVRQLYPAISISADTSFKHAHNIYLQAGAEMGLPGFIAHLVFYFALLRLLLKRALDPRAGYSRALALGLLGSLVAFLTHGFFEVITYAPRAAVVVWALFGLIVAVATGSVRQPHAN